jgi:hypothetical protein
MEAKDYDLKAFALSRLLAGDSYRKTQIAVQETFGRTVSLSTLNVWAHEDPEQSHAVSQAHLRAIGHQRVRIAHKAGEMLEEAIDSGAIPTGQKAIVFGVVSDKLDSMLKITQDNRNQNERIDAIRAELRKKPHELRSMVLGVKEHTPEPSPPPEPPSTLEVRRYHHLDGEVPGN